MNASVNTASPAPADELRTVVAKAEKLLTTLENSTDETVIKLRTRATQAINTARDRLSSMQNSTKETVMGAARATDDYVRENPWQTLAYGVVFGAFIGALIARRS